MARNVTTILLVLVVVVGSWALLHRDQIKNPADAVKLVQEKIAAFKPASSSMSISEGEIPVDIGGQGQPFLDSS